MFIDTWRGDDLGFFLWSSGRGGSWSASWLAPDDDRSTHGSITLRLPLGRGWVLDDSWIDFGQDLGAEAAVLRLTEPDRDLGGRSMTSGGTWKGPPRMPVLAAWFRSSAGDVASNAQYQQAREARVVPIANDLGLRG